MASVLVCYRDPSSGGGDYNVSHGGLVNNAMWTVRMLTGAGIACSAVRVWTAKDLAVAVRAAAPTHCVIDAQFISAAELGALLGQFPAVRFAQRCHSQIAFLATSPADVKLLLDYLHLQDVSANLQVSGNSRRFSSWVENTYRSHCLYLPNAYVFKRPGLVWAAGKLAKDTLRIASYGAIRLLKNQATAAAAALLIARRLGKGLEFHLNVGRNEGGNTVLTSIKNLFAGLAWAKLVLDPWTDWSRFNQLVSTMDLCYQLSSTETFNLVTADACAMGVPSVVGDAIEWAPKAWRSEIDDATEAAGTGIELLSNPLSVAEGQERLADYCGGSLATWKAWLGA